MKEVNINDFGFKNLKTIAFYTPPRFEKEHEEDRQYLFIPDSNDIDEVLIELLEDFKTSRAIGIILRNNNQHIICTPNAVIRGEGCNEGYSCLEMDPKEYDENNFISLFVEMVDETSISEVMILQEVEGKDNYYSVVYE